MENETNTGTQPIGGSESSGTEKPESAKDSSGKDSSSSNSKADIGTENNNKGDISDLDKLVNAKAERLTADISKKNSELEKELAKLKKEKMTADELKQFEISEKEKTLAEREKMLLDKENRLIAIKAIKEAGLDDGSDLSLKLVDFVMADNEDTIKARTKTFGELVKKLVAAEVDKTFKKNGRNPNVGSGNNGDNDKNNNIAETLGKARAAKQKQSNDILKYYGGR